MSAKLEWHRDVGTHDTQRHNGDLTKTQEHRERPSGDKAGALLEGMKARDMFNNLYFRF